MKWLELKILHLREIKSTGSEILHVRQMIWLELKILHVRLNKINRMGNTSCNTNEMSLIENTSCKVK